MALYPPEFSAVATMRVDVLGSSSSIPRPGRACSSYLVRSNQTSLVLDLGTGALANLRKIVDYRSLDAVVISHMHADHFLDVIPLRYALKYGDGPRGERTLLWLPPGGEAALRAAITAFPPEGTDDFLDEVFHVREYDPDSTLRISALSLSFARGPHFIDTYAIRVEGDGATLCYSADTAPSDAVTALAHDCDLFICECTLGLKRETSAMRGHLNAYEAGEMAQAARVRRLILTHYGNDTNPGDIEAAAASRFSGPCAIIDDGSALRL